MPDPKTNPAATSSARKWDSPLAQSLFGRALMCAGRKNKDLDLVRLGRDERSNDRADDAGHAQDQDPAGRLTGRHGSVQPARSWTTLPDLSMPVT